ncbi:hypothetical protein H0H92_009669, partial [Tricholoma furcatifolium]
MLGKDARAFLDVEAAESEVDEDEQEDQDLEGEDFIDDEGEEPPFQPILEETLAALSISHENDDQWEAYIARARRRAADALNLSRFDDNEQDSAS